MKKLAYNIILAFFIVLICALIPYLVIILTASVIACFIIVPFVSLYYRLR